MRGGDYADVHLDGVPSAQALEFLVLQYLQQLRLEFEIHVADFVQQDRATVGEPEHARLFLEGSRESAPLITEQLAFHQFGGQGGTIELPNRPFCAWGTGMQFPGQDFLAGTRLSLDQNRRFGPANLAEQVLQFPHLWGGAKKDLFICRGGRFFDAVGHCRRSRIQCQFERFAEILGFDRLGEEVVRAVLHGLPGIPRCRRA